MLYNNIFQLYNLRYKKKSVSLHRVFHSIRFKVNKGWAQRSPFLCPYLKRASYGNWDRGIFLVH